MCALWDSVHVREIGHFAKQEAKHWRSAMLLVGVGASVASQPVANSNVGQSYIPESPAA